MALSPDMVALIVPGALAIGFTGTVGWIFTTWLKIKNGYPLENTWGTPMLPHGGGETVERVKLLAQENAKLKAELGSVCDRLEVLERIATDRGSRLAAEIDSLATRPIN